MTDHLERYRVVKASIPPVFVLWTILMLALTLLPTNSIPDSKFFSYDKIGHFGMFGGWTFFLGLYMIVYKQKAHISLILLMLVGILFGAFIEVMQHTLPSSRTASWDDLIANSLGCLTASLLLHPVKNFLKRSS